MVVLSHRLWRDRFGGDPGVIGRTVRLNGHPFTVVGVAPAGYTGVRKFGFHPDLWVPMMMHAQVMRDADGILDDRESTWLTVAGRLKPGLDLDAASVMLSDFAAAPGADLSRDQSGPGRAPAAGRDRLRQSRLRAGARPWC